MNTWPVRYALGVAALLAGPALGAADTCMVSPTQQQEVTGRFGKFRAGGAANFGSGNSRPHMHDGLDFSTGGASAPVVATADGTVIWARLRGSAGNTVMIKRPNGDIVGYYHLASISVQEGAVVQAGQEVGRSGRTGMQPTGAVHLHFLYGVPNADEVRAKRLSAEAAKVPAFNPAQLPNAVSRKDFGYATDPSPYFCETFPIQDDGLRAVLGADTKEQYARLFGTVPPMGAGPDTQFDPVQVAAANGDALQAAGRGVAANIAASLSDAEGYGALPTPPLGAFETMSPAEMMTSEAKRRFADVQWNTDVATVGPRALRVDYLRALGVSVYLNEAIRAKKERVEALLALYTSQKLDAVRGRVAAAQGRAQRDDVARAIK